MTEPLYLENEQLRSLRTKKFSSSPPPPFSSLSPIPRYLSEQEGLCVLVILLGYPKPVYIL